MIMTERRWSDEILLEHYLSGNIPSDRLTVSERERLQQVMIERAIGRSIAEIREQQKARAA